MPKTGWEALYEFGAIDTDLRMSRRSSTLMSSRFKLSRTLFNARSVLNKCINLTRMFQSLRVCNILIWLECMLSVLSLVGTPAA